MNRWNYLEPIQTFRDDGRASLTQLYGMYDQFVSSGLFEERVIYMQAVYEQGIRRILKTRGFFTKREGPSEWIISGIHGEEPAGPNMIAHNVDFICDLAQQGYSLVVIPLANPNGYRRNWRYPNSHRTWEKGKTITVGDTDYLLAPLTPGFNGVTRAACSPSAETTAFTQYCIGLFTTHRPVLSLDFHEDEDSDRTLYIYADGKRGAQDSIAHKAVQILAKNGIEITREGTTRFNEPIINGVVSSKGDGSIDELLVSSKFFLNGVWRDGPAADVAIIIETPTIDIPLEKRIQAQRGVLHALPEFVKMIGC